jgi:hypothetical protein
VVVAQQVSASNDRSRKLLAFAAVTSLFFAWGFITSNNDPLIVTLRPRRADRVHVHRPENPAPSEQ